jgi:hypothetical protein
MRHSKARALFVLLLIASPTLANDHSLPDHTLTPGGVIEGATVAEICAPGYSQNVRHVTAETKREIYAEYGLAGNHTGYCDVDQGCEIDHLISLELGGSNDVTNLWPEPFSGITWNAHVKDRLENRLHEMVCKGEMPLAEAQKAISTDWIAAYHRYVESASGPPQETGTSLPTDQTAPAAETGTPEQFQTEDAAKAHCPADQVVWVSLKTDVLHLSGSRWYGATREGAYVCLGEAERAGWRLAANRQ